MTAQQNQCGAGLKLGTAVAAFPLQLGGQVALLHRSAQALTAAELSSLLHIFNIQLGLGLAFVIAVIQLVVVCVAGVLVELDDLKVFPLGGDLGPILVSAVVSGQTGLVSGRYPVQSTEILGGSDLLHEGLCTSGNQVLRQVARNLEVELYMIGQAVEVILDGQVLTEVQVLLQLVAVSIELTVEVLENEPVEVKQLLGPARPRVPSSRCSNS